MKKWLKISLWSLFIIGIAILIYFINKSFNERIVPAPEIIIHVDGENSFISKEELLSRLERNRLIYPGQTQSEINTDQIETFISQISQVKSVAVFQRIDGSWKIDVNIRKAIARIFNESNESYYLDIDGNVMLTTRSFTARALVFSGYIPDRKNSISVTEIINNDSLISIRKLDDIYRISNYVCDDPLFHSLIGQVYLEKNGNFILVPLVGDQKIVLGSALSEKEVEEKFEKLRIFYNEAIAYEGWNTYSEINLSFKDQIVCKKKNINE